MQSFATILPMRSKNPPAPASKSLRVILIGILILNCLSLLILSLSARFSQSQNSNVAKESSILMNAFTVSEPYNFDEPLLAYHLLKKFDEFKLIDPSYYNQLSYSTNWSQWTYMGLNVDEQYCDKHRAVFVNDPLFIFEQNNTLYDFWPKHWMRYIALQGVLTDFQPNVSSKVAPEDKTKRVSWINPRQNHFLINTYLHNFQHIGKNFACLTQSYNHIPGAGYLNRKDLVSEAMLQYAKQYENRPQCFSFEKSFPRTWIMYLKDQCEDFFKHLHSEEHDRLKALNGVVYIRKIGAGAHNGKGVFSMDAEEEHSAIDLYKNGSSCGSIENNTIIQYFIPNPLLLKGHKFDFRVYMLVASINPLIAYYYDGYLKVSLHKYESHSADKYALLTNTHVSSEVLKEATNGTLINGMNETELQYFQRWNFTKFQNYLLEEGIVADPHWIDNHLRPEFKRAMIHLLRMTQKYLLKLSAIYELFGVDFMLDENLDMWFIECNSSPSMAPTYPETETFIKKHLSDMLEIVKGITRSRTKRIIQFINNLTKERKYGMKADGEIIVDDYEEKKRDFDRAIENRFEIEFEPSPSNNYQPLIDETLEGKDRYHGLILEECL